MYEILQPISTTLNIYRKTLNFIAWNKFIKAKTNNEASTDLMLYLEKLMHKSVNPIFLNILWRKKCIVVFIIWITKDFLIIENFNALWYYYIFIFPFSKSSLD